MGEPHSQASVPGGAPWPWPHTPLSGRAQGSHGLKNLLASGKRMDLSQVQVSGQCLALPLFAWARLYSSPLLPSAFGASGVWPGALSSGPN